VEHKIKVDSAATQRGKDEDRHNRGMVEMASGQQRAKDQPTAKARATAKAKARAEPKDEEIAARIGEKTAEEDRGHPISNDGAARARRGATAQAGR
jgi:hypothetical protein